MDEYGIVQLYEDGAQNVYAAVYDKSGNLVNMISGIDKIQPLPGNALVQAARQGFPFSARWLAVEHGGKTMEQQKAELESVNRLLAVIPMTDNCRFCLYPEAADNAGKHFLIRWFF